jgi:hypothetical protein
VAEDHEWGQPRRRRECGETRAIHVCVVTLVCRFACPAEGCWAEAAGPLLAGAGARSLWLAAAGSATWSALAAEGMAEERVSG